ncbi:MAG: hypothetical protein EAZ97_15405 [Bacteroidetes bacterium]|nr:MAG: hypothetical protein EAZ97_15405 [Bacteroidota bacterium]
MYIKSLQIQNFKSFKDVKIDFNKEVNILTGVNNSGKTSILEAIALWQECFVKLLRQAERGTQNYSKNDFILGNTQNKYFPFEQINSVRSPNFEDIFYNQEKNNRILLKANIQNEGQNIEVGFQIGSSGSNYVIELFDFKQYNFAFFNKFFRHFPLPISLFYASPVSAIGERENFTTTPLIKDAIQSRKSASVLRNRLYALYRNNIDYSNFLSNLNYILFDNNEKLEFFTQSDIQKDSRVVFNFKIASKDNEKDLALLGSGSLQIIEILLNLYYREQKSDLNLVLLDEPDSYVHRDIQRRLLKIITEFSDKNQIFITTHNESLIRNSAVNQLFHLENKAENHYQALDNKELIKISKNGNKHFTGIYPLISNPIISSLSNSNGLDFINAIEADQIIFVEGEDDARIWHILLQKAFIPPKNKKYVFWVLGGISNVFKEIIAYKTVFSAIKNQQTLWEKSVLILDRDFYNDLQINDLQNLFYSEKSKSNIGIKTFIPEFCTLESVLLTEPEKLSHLLSVWILNYHAKNIGENTLLQNSKNAFDALEKAFSNKFTNHFYTESAFTLSGHKKLITEIILPQIKNLQIPKSISTHELKIEGELRTYIENCLQNKEFYKIAKKEEVELFINKILEPHGLVFDVEKDFINLIRGVDVKPWFNAWDFLKKL